MARARIPRAIGADSLALDRSARSTCCGGGRARTQSDAPVQAGICRVEGRRQPARTGQRRTCEENRVWPCSVVMSAKLTHRPTGRRDPRGDRHSHGAQIVRNRPPGNEQSDRGVTRKAGVFERARVTSMLVQCENPKPAKLNKNAPCERIPCCSPRWSSHSAQVRSTSRRKARSSRRPSEVPTVFIPAGRRASSAISNTSAPATSPRR